MTRLPDDDALRLSVCMIVKDEETRLPRLFASLEGIADEIVVVDTGSTDGTISLVKNAGCRLAHYPWNDDFAAARNVSLDLATGDWILVLDADERLLADGKELKTALADATTLAYRLRLDNLLEGEERTSERLTRLFRCRPDIRFEGRIHEQVSMAIKKVMVRQPEWRVNDLPGVVIEHDGYREAVMKERNKKERNICLLRQARKEAPDDLYYAYKLALELRESTEGGDLFIKTARRAMRCSNGELAQLSFGGELLINAAQTLLVRGEAEAGSPLLARFKEVFPPHPACALVEGEMLLQRGQGEAALEAASRASLPLPDEGMVVDGKALAVAANRLRIAALAAVGKRIEALREGVTWLKEHPSDAAVLVIMADVAESLGEQEAAKRWRERIMRGTA